MEGEAIAYQLCSVGINVVMAIWHAVLIKKHRPIYHGLWAAAYLAAAGWLAYMANSWLAFISMLLIRKVVFDTTLNVARGLPWHYTSRKTTSVMDKIQYKIFGREPILMYSLCTAIIIIINLFLTQKK